MILPPARKRRGSFGGLAVYLAVLCILPVAMPSLPLATEIAIMTLATLSCHLLLVYGPLLSFGQGAFFGVGAYIGGLYAIHIAGHSLADAGAALLLAWICTAAVAFAVGIVALRRISGLGGHGAGGVTFLMLTFAVAQVAYFSAYNLPQWTGGDNGLLDVPRLPFGFHGFLALSLTAPIGFYCFCAAVLGLVVLIVELMVHSTVGQAFKAIRENEHRAAAIGYNVFALRLALFTFTGGLAGISGALYAMFLGVVPLSAIDLTQSERIVVMAVLGGTGSPVGALLGTICFVLGSDLLSQIWPHWPLALGAIIVLIVFFARGGVLGLIEIIGRAVAFVPRLRRKQAGP